MYKENKVKPQQYAYYCSTAIRLLFMPVASPYPFSELFKIRWTRYLHMPCLYSIASYPMQLAFTSVALIMNYEMWT